MPNKIELKMIDNGLDFILRSFNDLENNELKYTALHLYSGVLLILKERLYNVDEKLIFENTNKYNRNSLRNGNFQSVKYETLLSRLKEANIIIQNEFKAELDWLRSERNKMEHFHVNIRIEALKSHIVNILIHLVPFIKNELVYNYFLDEDDEKLQFIIEYLHKYNGYIKAKLKSIEQQEHLKIQMIDGLQCPYCSNDTIIIEGDSEAYCYFCETRFTDFEVEYINENYNLHEIAIDGGTDPRYECIDCRSQAMIYIEDSHSYICLCCGVWYSAEQIATCARCESQLVYNKYPDEPAFCDYCLDFFISS
ncbi:hypothetical protein [Neobacillus muris]|uniref:hypothetical protein n=1 Tax=Neobacillus muris TaxID=2941334 RepID=UPI00203F4BC6|nr:hypothetical protein [Neobacillus muris]